jgi:hypothetical protein
MHGMHHIHACTSTPASLASGSSVPSQSLFTGSRVLAKYA